MSTCACHGKPHRDENVTRVQPVYADGDPGPPYASGEVYLCAKGLRERTARIDKLNRARRTYPRGGRVA
jgi:hypothetical protein